MMQGGTDRRAGLWTTSGLWKTPAGLGSGEVHVDAIALGEKGEKFLEVR